jgi:uncharacterized protein YeaO (DUF488 family)
MHDRGHHVLSTGEGVAMTVKVKRVYEEAGKEDGTRILVDRIWPRGLRRDKAMLDLWLKEVAPSTELRKWFGHDPERWPEFQRRYRKELQLKDDQLSQLREEISRGPVTLLYGAKDEKHNQAIVLQRLLLSQ